MNRIVRKLAAVVQGSIIAVNVRMPPSTMPGGGPSTSMVAAVATAAAMQNPSGTIRLPIAAA